MGQQQPPAQHLTALTYFGRDSTLSLTMLIHKSHGRQQHVLLFEMYPNMYLQLNHRHKVIQGFHTPAVNT
jgi:hypothetical protein